MSVVLEYPAPLRHRTFRWFLNTERHDGGWTYAANWALSFGIVAALFLVVSNLAMYISFQKGDGTLGYHLWPYIINAIVIIVALMPMTLVMGAKVLPKGYRASATIDFEKLNDFNKARYLPILIKMYEIGRNHPGSGNEALRERRELISQALLNQQRDSAFVDDDRSDIEAVKQVEEIYRNLQLDRK